MVSVECIQPKQLTGMHMALAWPKRRTAAAAAALRSLVYSPVEFIVVIMCLPPKVKPDEQQTEGEEEDEGPEQLPLEWTHKYKNIIPAATIYSTKIDRKAF